MLLLNNSVTGKGGLPWQVVGVKPPMKHSAFSHCDTQVYRGKFGLLCICKSFLHCHYEIALNIPGTRAILPFITSKTRRSYWQSLKIPAIFAAAGNCFRSCLLYSAISEIYIVVWEKFVWLVI